MKNYQYILLLAVSLSLGSCSDYLNIVPDGTATMDNAFSNRQNAEKFLHTCYSYIPNYSDVASSPGIMCGDETTFAISNLQAPGSWDRALDFQKGRQKKDGPLFNFWDGGNGGSNLWIGIRDCNMFLDNIDIPKDLPEDIRERWIAEVTFLKAFYHYYLLRMYGPIPIMDDDIDVSTSVEGVRLYRDKFDDVVNYIVTTIDNVVEKLPLVVVDAYSETGRITQPIAYCLKAEVLALAASPLFNGNSDYANLKDNRGELLFSQEYDANKWRLAADAALQAIESAHDAQHQLYYYRDFAFNITDVTRKLLDINMVLGDVWNEEIIFAGDDSPTGLQQYTAPALDVVEETLREAWNVLSVSMNVAEDFYTSNGVPMSEDKTEFWSENYDERYSPTIIPDEGNNKYLFAVGDSTAIFNMNREPRFYACLGFDRGSWYVKDLQNDLDAVPRLKVRKGEYGNNALSQYNITGYYNKKICGINAFVRNGKKALHRFAFPIFRLANMYLLYAECLNETLDEPNEEVYKYVDLVRERAGLEGVVESWLKYSKNPDAPKYKEDMRRIIHLERKNELACEGQRFWDMRRWKEQPKTIMGWTTSGRSARDYYIPVDVSIRDNKYSYKDYLWPLSISSIQRNPNLVQNPGW